jgi:hypothetical protein
VASALLGLLPAMTRDTSCAALVWRVLRPLAAAAQAAQQQSDRAPHIKQGAAAAAAEAGLTRALVVALSVGGWLATGRGWGRAEAAINGSISAPGGLVASAPATTAAAAAAARGREPLQLRLLRAQAVRCV